jgi:hypothetical protein
MRRALNQPRFEKIEMTDGQIWGVPSEPTYDPFELYERGVAPHLAFANAKNPLEWHKVYGPLFGCSGSLEDDSSSYSSTIENFLGAQGRFTAVLRLWQAWKRDCKDIRECFLRAVTETGIVTLPGHGTVLNLNPDWEAEVRDYPTFMNGLAGKAESPRASVGVLEKNSFAAATDFARSESDENLRQAGEELLKYALAERLAGIQPDFRNQRGFEPTWIVRDFLQACYLMLFFDMTKRQGIRNCKFCGQFFYPTTKRPRFCSPECARKNRQRRYWKRRGKRLRRKRIAEGRSDNTES